MEERKVIDSRILFDLATGSQSKSKTELSVRGQKGPGKPGKSWNFILMFSRTGKSWKSYGSSKVLEICLFQAVKFSEYTKQEMYVNSMEN